MKTNHGLFGMIIGGIVAVAAAFFIFSGGELGGKKTVEGDQDLPPVAATDRDSATRRAGQQASAFKCPCSA